MNVLRILLSLILVLMISCCGDEKERLESIAGTGNPGFSDGTAAEMNKPIRFSRYKNNEILFADINNHAIRTVNEAGVVRTIGGGPDKSGFSDGNTDTARFRSPHGVAYNANTNKIYMASAVNHVIREISETDEGNFFVKTIAGIPGESGYKDGSIDSALFRSPHGVLVREDGALVIIDIGNAKLRLVKDGMVSTLAGKTEEDPLMADWLYPIDITFDGEDVLICDAGNNNLFRVRPGESAEVIFLHDTLDTPHGIAVDEKHNIYIADMGSNSILKIDPEGRIETLVDATTDSTAVSYLQRPAAVMYDRGYLWIADLDNHQIKRLKIR